MNPSNRLVWRRWRIVEGLDVRVGCHRNPPPEGLTPGGHRAFLDLVRERRPFWRERAVSDNLDSIVTTIERRLGQWTAA